MIEWDWCALNHHRTVPLDRTGEGEEHDAAAWRRLRDVLIRDEDMLESGQRHGPCTDRVPRFSIVRETDSGGRAPTCRRKPMNEAFHKPLAAAGDTRTCHRSNRFLEGLKRPGKDICVPQPTPSMRETELCMSRCEGYVMP